MLSALKKSLRLYKTHIGKILVIGLSIILPVQIIYTLVVNFLTLPFFYFGIPLWPDIFQGLFMIMGLYFIQLPLISLAIQSWRSDEVKLSKVYGDTLEAGFFVYLASIPYAIFTTLGMFLFVLPGIVLLILFMGVPFIKLAQKGTAASVFRQAFRFGKDHFFSILGILFIFALVDFALSYGISAVVFVYIGQIAALNWTLMIINMLLLPLFVFTISYLYAEWSGEREEQHIESDEDSPIGTSVI